MKDKHFSKMTESELSQVITDANLVQEIVDNPNFNKFIKDELLARYKVASEAQDWKPGKIYDVSAVALCNAFNSGRKSALLEIDKIVEEYLNDKDEVIRQMKTRKETKV